MKKEIVNIQKRIHPKNEVWYLRVKSEDVLDIPTRTKRERNILNAIRKILITYGFTSDSIELTNRDKYVKHVHISKEKVLKKRANLYPHLREYMIGDSQNLKTTEDKE